MEYNQPLRPPPPTPRHPNGGTTCSRVDCDCLKLALNISKFDLKKSDLCCSYEVLAIIVSYVNKCLGMHVYFSIRLMKTNCSVYCRTFSWFGSAFYIKLLTNVLCVLFNDAVSVLRLYHNCDSRISMEHWWNVIDRGNRNTLGGGLSTAYLTWAGLGPNMGLRGERPATNRLIHQICRFCSTFSFRSWHSKQLSERFWRNV